MDKTSAILLNGGKSSRMGVDKAALMLGGKRLLQWQTDKIRALGISDILLCGGQDSLPDTRWIADEYPHRGPLGGLHAGLKHAAQPCCLVLSVDVPLIPASLLRDLIQMHLSGDAAITLVSYQGMLEPLIGVYDSVLHDVIAPLIRGGPCSVRALLDQVHVARYSYEGPAEYLLNCNTPEDYRRLCACISHSNAESEKGKDL